MSETVLTKTLRDGRIATFTLDTCYGGVTVTSRIDGKEHAETGPPHRRPGLPAGYVAEAGGIGLTEDETTQLAAACEAFQAAIPRDPRNERERLVERIRAVRAGWQDDREAAWDDFDGSGNPFAGDAAARDRLARAQDALTAFDAEHPSVAEDVERARLANVRRWMDQ